jgi:hypothetical protein
MPRADRGGHKRGEDTNNNWGPILVKCGCPAVDGWAKAKLEAHSKRLIADAKKTAKRKKCGAGRQEARIRMHSKMGAVVGNARMMTQLSNRKPAGTSQKMLIPLQRGKLI